MKRGSKTKYPLVHPMPEASAKAAFEALRSTLEALPRADLLPIRVDVQHAAAIAHSVGVRDTAQPRRARLETLAKVDAFNMGDIDRLPSVALATWYARQQQRRLNALASEAMVPVVVVKDAQNVRARMLRVLEYYFDDDAQIAPRLTAIRAGAGLQDLANDLEELADLYEEDGVRLVVSQDAKRWKNDDMASARKLASAIFRGLGLAAQGESAKWADYTQRAWTLLFSTYQEARAVGQFVFRKDEDIEISYPSLVSATRNPASRTKDDAPAQPGPEPASPPTAQPPQEDRL